METETSIKFIRMKNGEDLIADTLFVEKDDVDEAHFFLFKPLKIVYMMSSNMAGAGPGYGGARIIVSLVPWIMPDIVMDTEFEVQPEDILLVSQPSPAMVKYYVEFHKANPDENTEPLNEDPNTQYGDSETIDITKGEGIIMLNKLLESRSQQT